MYHPMPTLILSPRYTVDSRALLGAAVEAGWNVERLQSWRVPADWADSDVVVYGEALFCAAVAEQLSLALIQPAFEWLAELPETYRRRVVRFGTLAEARKVAECAFFKPADDKCFPAKVYESGRDLEAFDYLDETTPVLVSEPVEWEVEFRCFVRDRKVLTSSPYWRDGRLAQIEDGTWPASETETVQLENFTKTLLDDLKTNVPSAFVLDVGIVRGKGWAVVEVNPAWGSGVYGCDPARVLETVAGAVRRGTNRLVFHSEARHEGVEKDVQ